MIILLVLIDVILMLLSILVATAVGGRSGDEFFPNISILVVVFFILRTLLVWVLFRSIVNRELSFVRNFFQIIFLLTLLSLVSFVLTAVPTYFVSSESWIADAILFFTSVQGKLFYLLIIPVMTFIVSLVVHKFYKLEPW